MNLDDLTKTIESILECATKVSTPVGLAAFIVAALLVILIILIAKGIFPQLKHNYAAQIIILIIERLFQLLLLAVILAFVGYVIFIVYTSRSTSKQGNQDNKEQELSTNSSRESVPQPASPLPAPEPNATSSDNVKPRKALVRVDVDVSSIASQFDNTFAQKLSKAVSEIAPRINGCFVDYTTSQRVTLTFTVQVLSTPKRTYATREDINNPYENVSTTLDSDIDKMKDVVCSADFPPPVAYRGVKSVPDSYLFNLNITFVPQDN